VIADSNARTPVPLTLYVRKYCHLCDDMLAELDSLRSTLTFTVDLVDVDADAQIEARYGELVPVLAHRETPICHYFLDRAALTAYLDAFG
jgi:thioredoxin reductase (NADPH)